MGTPNCFVEVYLEKNAKSNADAARYAIMLIKNRADLRRNYLGLVIRNHDGHNPLAHPREGFYRIDYGVKNISYLLKDGPFVLFEKKGAYVNDSALIKHNIVPQYVEIQKVGTTEAAKARLIPNFSIEIKEELRELYRDIVRE